MGIGCKSRTVPATVSSLYVSGISYVTGRKPGKTPEAEQVRRPAFALIINLRLRRTGINIMKKIKFFPALTAAAMVACCVFTSCDPESPESFAILDFEGDQWTALVDSPQYGGPQLYAAEAYSWYDAGNTGLWSEGVPQDFDKGLYGYSGGGIAVSNYVEKDISKGDYLSQLAICTDGGHDGSSNFAVVFDGFSCKPFIEFKDGVARVIDHMYVTNTTYAVNFLSNGDPYNPAMASNGYFEVTAKGFKADGTTAEASIRLAEGRNIVKDWKCWDLSGLGAVQRLEFTVSGSEDLYGAYGFNAPTYFAIDDIAVVVSDK